MHNKAHLRPIPHSFTKLSTWSRTPLKTQKFCQSVMVLKQVFTIIALCNGLGNAWFRPPKCSYRVCTGYDWRDDWSPSVSQGKCVMQARKGHPLYKTQTASFVCPPTMPCPFKIEARKMCEYGFVLFGDDCGMILVLI